MIRAILIIAVALVAAAFFYFDLNQYLDFAALKQHHSALLQFVSEKPIVAAGAYFGVYVAVTTLSLPGAAVLTLLGGAIFGFFWGTVLVSFASTLGATGAFLLSRYLFRDMVAKRYQARMKSLDEGIRKDGPWYLFGLRLVPLFPFFVVNLAMGLTAIKTSTYAFISQLGMLPATLVFVNAGTQLAKIESAADVLSTSLLLSFAALGLFPLAAKRVLERIKADRILASYPRPRHFDRNLIVIGAGSAGLVSAYIAAATKASVTLIERHKMGGDCLNTGCVPSKALLRSAKLVHQAQHGQRYGLPAQSPDVDFAQVMARVKRVVATIEPHDSVERYTSLGVECISGEARIVSPYCVRIGETELSAKHIIVAAGARPFVPPIPGLDSIDYLTSDTLWDLKELPKRLLVLGGGPIGCELAQAFGRLGSVVTQVEMAPRLLMREDECVSECIRTALENDGIKLMLNRRVIEFNKNEKGAVAVCQSVGDENDRVQIEFDQVIVAVGRRANTTGFGLEELGVEINDNGTVATDKFLATNFPNIYACGDVAGPYQFTHTASHQAWYAAVNSLFGGVKRFAVDYSVIPWCTFTDPEVARVGINETEAREQEIEYELTEFDIGDLDRAIADEAAYGFVRVLTVPDKDKILGVTIVAEHAGDLIAEFVLAMKHNIGLNKILGTIHIYPTMAEANKSVAGVWRQAHAPQWALKIAARFHARGIKH